MGDQSVMFQRFNSLLDPGNSFLQPLRAGGKGKAKVSFTLGAEDAAGHKGDLLFSHQVFGQVPRAESDPGDVRKSIESPFGEKAGYCLDFVQASVDNGAPLLIGPAHLGHAVLGALDRSQGGTRARPPISNYMSELPNSYGRALTVEPYVIHGILSGTASCTPKLTDSIWEMSEQRHHAPILCEKKLSAFPIWCTELLEYHYWPLFLWNN